jgi:UDP-N-acetylmuramate dehydrogenase
MDWLIIGAKIQLTPHTSDEIAATINKNISKRMLTQPLKAKTFGSIFKNPKNNSAGKILDDLGFRGYTYKNLQISEKHANFMVNLGNSDFQDIITLIKIIQTKVKNETGIKLELEVQIIS